MLAKRSSFTDPFIAQCDRGQFLKASQFETALSGLALDLSIFKERAMPTIEVERLLTSFGFSYKGVGQHVNSFVKAAQTAHRLETSLRLDEGIGAEQFVKNPLSIRFKFYYKRERVEFLEWKIVIGELGHVLEAGTTGRGKVGKLVTT